MVKNCLILLLCCISFLGNAQNIFNQNKAIDTIFINAKLNTYGKSNVKQILDSAVLVQYASKNIADVLMQNGNANVKNYGPSNLSYMSIRGSSASQVAVLWNGVNINAASLGATDMSLLPAYFFSEMHIQYGGNSLAWGSGDVGGSIHLNIKNNNPAGNTIQLGAVIASFGNKQYQAALQTGNKILTTNTKILWHYGENNFKYLDPTSPNFGYKKNTNAQNLQYGVMHQSRIAFNKNNIWEAKIWLQNTTHNLPSSATQANSEQWQQDWHARIMLDNKIVHKALIINTKLAYFKEYLRFQDSTINIDSKYYTNNFFADVEANYNNKGNAQLYTAITAQHINMITDEYAANPILNKIALRTGAIIKSNNDKWNWQTGARLENNNNTRSPLLFNMVCKFKISKKLNAFASIANNFRLPSFNDMYWKIGGNKNLKSETGITQEIGMNFAFKKHSINLALYNRNINNWIIWLPNANNIWTPSNIAKVQSKGIDIISSHLLQILKLPLQITGTYTYLNSVNKQINNTTTYNKQLIYVPHQKATLNIVAYQKQSSYSLSAMYTGLQYTSSDNLNVLSSYIVANCQITKQFQIKNINFNALLGINNIFNSNYQAVAARPMPLRNYSLGLTTSIINKK
jgi:vitamin B12 transporter